MRVKETALVSNVEIHKTQAGRLKRVKETQKSDGGNGVLQGESPQAG